MSGGLNEVEIQRMPNLFGFVLKRRVVMEKRITIFNYILLLLSIIIFGEYLVKFANFATSYILFSLFFIILALHVFIVGIIINKEKVYKRNIKLYFVLYIILLISLTVFVNKPDFTLFDFKYFQMYIENINFIPFRTIFHIITADIGLGFKILNILGHIIAFIPLTIILILFNKRYESYKSQFKILFLAFLVIEFFQFLLAVGHLDIDYFILNIGGAMLFLTILKKFNLAEKLNKLFKSDLNLSLTTKYILLALISIMIIIMDILFLLDLNYVNLI